MEQTLVDEACSDTPFGPEFANLARQPLLQVSPKAKWGDRARAAAAVSKSFSITVQPDGSLTAGLDVAATEGRGDTGNLGDDLADVLKPSGRPHESERRALLSSSTRFNF